MNDLKTRLDQDLRQKLDHLHSILRQPALHVAKRFDQTINSVDYDAERILQDEACPDDLKRKANEARLEFVRILKRVEADLQHKLSAQESSDADQAFACLEERAKKFLATPTSDGDGTNDVEERYLELALEAVAQTNEQEKKVFGNQTLFYRRPEVSNKTSLGALVHLKDCCLAKEETKILSTQYFPTILAEVWSYPPTERISFLTNAMIPTLEEIEVLFAKAFEVATSLKFMTPHKLTTMARIVQHLSDDCDYWDREKSSKYKDNQQAQIVRIGSLMDTDSAAVAASVDESGEIKQIDLQISDDPEELASYSDLSRRFNNCKSGEESKSLNDQYSRRLDNKSSIEPPRSSSSSKQQNEFILSHLAKLPPYPQKLSLRIPDGPVDFVAFQALNSLTSLSLRAAESANLARPRLTSQQMHHLSLPRLQSLSLSNFDIGPLDQEAMLGFQHLTSLSLADCGIARIHQDAFKHHPRLLKKLDLSKNQLAELTDDVFVNMSLLESLDLDFNEISRLSSNCFRGLSSLRKLTLRVNRIRELPDGMFRYQPSLSDVNLACNLMTRIKRETFSTSFEQNLKILNLSSNPIDTIDDDAFEELDRLSFLAINSCKLKFIHNRMFTGLTQLRQLDLGNNSISSFRMQTVDGLVEIDSADLTPQQLQIVQQTMFKDLAELFELQLSRNKLAKLDLSVFCNLAKLQDLNLSSNGMSELKCQARGEILTNLSKLCLNDNQLTRLTRNDLPSSIALCELGINNNQLKQLDDGLMGSFEDSSTCLEFDNNPELAVMYIKFEDDENLYHHLVFNLDDASLPSTLESMAWHYELDDVIIHNSNHQTIQRIFTNQSETCMSLSLNRCSLQTCDGLDVTTSDLLGWLSLRGNMLSTIKTEWFHSRSLNDLQELDLSDNLIETLDQAVEVFAKIPGLQDLNLSGNRLTSINRRIFQGLFKLQKLNLANNKLSSIDDGLFRSLFSLTDVDVSSNSIKSLSLPKLFENCRKLERLNLSNNELDNTTLNRTSMDQLACLKELKLAGNSLRSIDFVVNLSKLELLDLSNNLIESVETEDFCPFYRMDELRTLNLSGNLIKRFSKKTLIHLKHRVCLFDIASNPLDLALFNPTEITIAGIKY